MAPVRNARVLFNQAPKGYPVPGETTVYDESQTIDLNTVPLNGGVLFKTLLLSIDPFLRRLMPDGDRDWLQFVVGQPLFGLGIAVVVRSENDDARPGDHFTGMTLHQEYFVSPSVKDMQLLVKEPGLSWAKYLGSAGMVGKTAYKGWREFSKAKKAKTVFVTSGAGAVGSLVIQLAKRDGTKVIASAGSDAKVEYMKSLGADVAFNYKTESTKAILEREGPIDIFWDHVGGETLDIALNAANKFARFIICGSISTYNGENPGVKNTHLLTSKSITMSGFSVLDWDKYDDEFYATFPKLLASGELVSREQVTPGLDQVGQVILDVQKGNTTGKAVILVAEE
ncbi:alcohol dehydrogenase [Fistulina hepatica ATCC 64428]|uniref:Alcohol dehydrogenase n=1 Tax=Fistulina hepatica ATCC 64428 TaxID=1128425 RepID=A0A0D7AI63_9AGAR|nr:alcohol dehydrogenase [Fistulina hepatica ATCC 64428]